MVSGDQLDNEWQSDAPAYLRHFLAHPQAPRPRSYAAQLLVDVFAWRCWVFWIVGLIPLVLGVVFGWWIAIALGVYFFVTYLRMLRAAVLLCRQGNLVVGVIQTLTRTSNIFGFSASGALLPDGRVVRVTMATRCAREMLAKHERVEVLLVETPDCKEGMVIGMRPAKALPAANDSH